MPQEHRLARCIWDTAWHQLVQSLTYKTEYAGHAVVLVDPNGTWQRCSGFGMVVRKSNPVRVHACPGCGLESDRAINTAIIILALGLVCLDNFPRNHPTDGVE